MFATLLQLFILLLWFKSINFVAMKKMTIKQYADKCGISVQAAHKRLDSPSKYREIVSIEHINKNFFLIEVNPRKGFTVNATMLQK